MLFEGGNIVFIQIGDADNGVRLGGGKALELQVLDLVVAMGIGFMHHMDPQGIQPVPQPLSWEWETGVDSIKVETHTL